MTERPEIESLAEALSWTSGEMTRWSETAHPDHNRWSWCGDGHGDALRDHFREQAQALIDLGWTRDLPPAASECPSRCGWNDPCPDPWHDRRVLPPEASCTCGFLRDPSDPHSAQCIARATRVLPPGSGDES